MNINKILIAVTGSALAAGVVILLSPSPAQSKPRQSDMVATQSRQAVQKKAVESDWEPVQSAMSAGNVAGTAGAVAQYTAKGDPKFDSMRVTLAKFYISHGDNSDAKNELDPIVHGDTARIGGKWTAPQGYDPRVFDLWVGVSSGVPSAERDSLVGAWAAAYRANGLKPGAFPEMGPSALMEYTVGQECLGSAKTRSEALDHFRRAFAAAPSSLEIAQQLIMELRHAGNAADAKAIALQAANLTDDPKLKFSIHAMGGVTKEDVAAANGKP